LPGQADGWGEVGRDGFTALTERYTLIEQVGEGGMGVVWRAHDRNLERDVAIKLLRSFVAGEPGQRLRFAREARTLAGLANEHIVRVYDYADVGELSFLVMEFIDGTDLAAETVARLPLSPAEAAAYLAPVAAGLGYAHGLGVVHRDLTPTNILIERESGRVLTTDFGLAQAIRSAGSLTAPGVLIGTPEYWSPEQAMGSETDPATDVFALGCIFFLLVTGDLPFTGDDRLAVGLRRAHENAPSLREKLPGAPEAVIDLVDRLLARAAGRRPAASVVATELRELAGSQRVRVTVRRAVVAASTATLVIPAEKSTLSVPKVAADWAPAVPGSSSTSPRHTGHRAKWGRLLVAFAVAGAATFGALFLAALHQSVLRVPAVVTLDETAARAKLRRLLPGSPLIVKRSYSTRVARGSVISQQPRAQVRVRQGASVRLVVSEGTPFVAVPPVTTGTAPAAARAALARSGLRGRYRWEPSWTVRKGTVVELRPAVGTRIRRPAKVTIMVASGYPRAVVPNLRGTNVAAAETQLRAKHLRFRIRYRLAPRASANQVLGQWPNAGASVYQGTKVQLAVAHTSRWVKVFADSGSRGYQSDAFTVLKRWRIRYRLTAGDLGFAVAQVSWSPDGTLLGGTGFTAYNGDGLRTYVVRAPGTYRLSVSPYLGASWYVEVDAYR
jgi:serine/threonine-protein kinase